MLTIKAKTTNNGVKVQLSGTVKRYLLVATAVVQIMYKAMAEEDRGTFLEWLHRLTGDPDNDFWKKG